KQTRVEIYKDTGSWPLLAAGRSMTDLGNHHSLHGRRAGAISYAGTITIHLGWFRLGGVGEMDMMRHNRGTLNHLSHQTVVDTMPFQTGSFCEKPASSCTTTSFP
nr:hypothetical protein [Escherichia coli]